MVPVRSLSARCLCTCGRHTAYANRVSFSTQQRVYKKRVASKLVFDNRVLNKILFKLCEGRGGVDRSTSEQRPSAAAGQVDRSVVVRCRLGALRAGQVVAASPSRGAQVGRAVVVVVWSKCQRGRRADGCKVRGASYVYCIFGPLTALGRSRATTSTVTHTTRFLCPLRTPQQTFSFPTSPPSKRKQCPMPPSSCSVSS